MYTCGSYAQDQDSLLISLNLVVLYVMKMCFNYILNGLSKLLANLIGFFYQPSWSTLICPGNKKLSWYGFKDWEDH